MKLETAAILGRLVNPGKWKDRGTNRRIEPDVKKKKKKEERNARLSGFVLHAPQVMNAVTI